MARLVDKNIHPDEIIVRCLLRSYLNKSRTTITKDSLEPKVGECDLSLLRLEYTDTDFCIKHGRSLGQKVEDFSGLLYLTSTVVDGMNQWAQSRISAEEIDGKRDCNGVTCKIVYSPMDKNENYLPTNIDVYAEDALNGDYPMHADLRYNERVVIGEQSSDVNTRIRKYARKMIERVKYQLSSPSDNTILQSMKQEIEFEKYRTQPILSIIVPFTQASKYILSCANSILPQAKDKPVEVLFINNEDSSSIKIIDEIRKDYPKEVELYGQKKTGLAEVRNRGLELARGRYIWWVEGDDIVCDNAINTVLHAVSSVDKDVYMFGIEEFNADETPKKETRRQYCGQSLTETTGIDVLLGHYSFSPVQMCVFRREFLISNEFKFSDCLHPDQELMPRLLLKARHVAQFPDVIYHYYHHINSCFKSDYSVSRTSDLLKIIDYYQAKIDGMGEGKEKEALYVSQFRLLRHVICDPKRNQFLSNKDRWGIKKRMPLFRKILRNTISFVNSGSDLFKWVIWYISPTIYKWIERREDDIH